MPGTKSPVVVGVDCSERSVSALRWAAYEALKRDAVLVAVHAFGEPYGAAPYAPARVSLSDDSAARQAMVRLSRCLRAALGEAPPVPVRTVCDSRRPVPALLDHATAAALLVLTARTDPAGGAMLGPVARDVLRRAPCPTVLLPVPTTASPGAEVAVAMSSRPQTGDPPTP